MLLLTFMVRSSFRGPPRLSSPPPDLSDATLYQKAELEARVAELEAELAAVRMAYSTAADTAALDKKAHNAQLSSLNKQMALTFPKVRFHMSIAAPCHCMNLPNRLKTRSSYV